MAPQKTLKRKASKMFNEKEKYLHKSSLILHRETKKIRTFFIQKLTKQVKQIKTQISEKNQEKLQKQIENIEKKQKFLKQFDLKLIIKKIHEETGLLRLVKASKSLEEDDEDQDQENDHALADDDDEQEEAAEPQQQQEQPEQEEQQEEDKKHFNEQEDLIQRFLSHKQMVPLVETIGQYVTKEERDHTKKKQRRDKMALRKKAKLMTGCPPTSLFVGSLSGIGGAFDDEEEKYGIDTYEGDDHDDIATFLGENKKKNRPGQRARRQKAIERERKENGETNVHYNNRDQRRDTRRGGERERGGGDRRGDRGGDRRGDRGGGGRDRRGEKGGDRGDRRGEKGGDRGDRRGGDRRPPSSSQQRPSTRRPPVAPQQQAAATAQVLSQNHPSWAARQAQKEKEKIQLTQGFAGKKITFDD